MADHPQRPNRKAKADRSRSLDVRVFEKQKSIAKRRLILRDEDKRRKELRRRNRDIKKDFKKRMSGINV